MKKTILIIGVVAIFSTISLAQTKNDTIQLLQQQIVNLEKLNSRMSIQINAAISNIKNLEDRLTSNGDSIAVLKNELVLTNNSLNAMSDKLESQILRLSEKSNSDYLALDKRVSSNSLYWILGFVSVLLFSAILFFWLRSRLTIGKTELSDQIKKSSESIREEIIKLDNQVFWSLDFQKTLNKKEQNDFGNVDHTLALKVADEIIRIHRNLSAMDPETRGLKQLEFAVERIQDNFTENGYEMVELLNKPYDQAMKVSGQNLNTTILLKRENR